MSEQAKRRAKSSGQSRITATNPRGLPTVAIVGRPNVGKSTLLNRIVGRREAIVEERPGVTRDRKDVESEWSGVPFLVIDTGGWMEGGNSLDDKVSRQAEKAIEDADLVLFVTDVTVGATPEDEAVADILRRRRPKGSTFVIANKVDGETREPDIWAFAGLGPRRSVPRQCLARPRRGRLPRCGHRRTSGGRGARGPGRVSITRTRSTA